MREILYLAKMPCDLSDRNLPVQGFTRAQCLMGVCSAITINKAPGQFFSSVVDLDTRATLFSHGQLCVRLSRVTHPANLTRCVPPDSDGKTKNIIYPGGSSMNFFKYLKFVK